MRFTKASALAVGLALLGATACKGGNGFDTGGVQVTVRTDALAGSHAGIVWLKLTDSATPPGVRWMSGIPSSGGYTFSLMGIATGSYTLDAYAYQDGAFDPTLAGPDPADWQALGVPLTITPGVNSIATIYLQQVAPPSSVANDASRVVSLSASMYNVFTGSPPDQAILRASVQDADGDPMTCHWSVSPAGAGSFTATTNAVAGGAAPSTGLCATGFNPTAGYSGVVSVSLELVDGHVGSPVSSVVSIALSLSQSTRANASIPVQLNGTPDISYFSASAGMLLANGADTSVLTVRTLDDVGDVVTATFSVAGAACGSVSPLTPTGLVGAPGETTFVATYTAGVAAGDCTLTVSAVDNHGSPAVSGSLVLHQVASWPTSYGPEFALASQSATRVDWVPDAILGGSSSTVGISFELYDPNVAPAALVTNLTAGFALAYTSSDAAALVTDLGFGVTSSPSAWDASYSTTLCATPPAAPPYTASVAVTASASLAGVVNTRAFPVTVHCLSVAIDQVGAAVAPSGTLPFTATVLVGDGAPALSGVTWAVVETGGGSIDAAGSYTAPAAAGTYHVVATSIDDPAVSATVPVIVQ